MGTTDVYGYDLLELTSEKVIKIVYGQAQLANPNAALQLVSGAAATPSLTFQADTNTGLHWVSDGVFAVVSNGVEVARFTSTGLNITGVLGGSAVQASAYDTSAGKVLILNEAGGSFGLGSHTAQITDTNGLNMITWTGWNHVGAGTSATVGGPSGAGAGVVETIQHNSAGTSAYQAFLETSSPYRRWSRSKTGGTWSSWFQSTMAVDELGHAGGVGAGGTVTQATSKSTSVTINTQNGKITTASDSLAAGATVTFTVNNSTMTTNDRVVINPAATSDYSAEVFNASTGLFQVRLKNNSAGALAVAVVLGFSIVKGSTT